MSTSTRPGGSTDDLKREIEQQYARRDVEVVASDTVDPIETQDVMACSPWCAPTL